MSKQDNPQAVIDSFLRTATWKKMRENINISAELILDQIVGLEEPIDREPIYTKRDLLVLHYNLLKQFVNLPEVLIAQYIGKSDEIPGIEWGEKERKKETDPDDIEWGEKLTVKGK